MKTRRLLKALKRMRLQPGDMLVVAPSVDTESLLIATGIYGRHRPELVGTPIVRAWPHEIAAAPQAPAEPGEAAS